MALPQQVPIRCLQASPTSHSIYFMGVAVNLAAIAEIYSLDHSYLSRIFRRERRPSLDYADKIAEALGMDTEAFLAGLKKQRKIL